MIVGDGMLAALVARRIYGHLQPVALVASDVALDSACRRVRHAPHHGHVFPARGFIEKLSPEMGFCIGCFGHHEQSRRVFVYSVHKAETRVADIIVGGVAEMPCESVDERAGIVAVSRMHYKSGRFVDDEYRFVFVHNVERNVFGYDFKVVARAVHHYEHGVERLYAVVAFYRSAVHDYASGLCGLLNAVAARLLKPERQKFVHTQQFLALVCYESEMFV